MTFMTHPQHGANNVSPSEVAEQEKAGWKVTDPAEWIAAKVRQKDTPDAAQITQVQAVPWRKKPGPKPKGY